MDSIIMTECVIITRRAQKILKGTIKIEPTCINYQRPGMWEVISGQNRTTAPLFPMTSDYPLFPMGDCIIAPTHPIQNLLKLSVGDKSLQIGWGDQTRTSALTH